MLLLEMTESKRPRVHAAEDLHDDSVDIVDCVDAASLKL